MGSSENLANLQPWTSLPNFPDSWISEAYACDTEILTKALQQSLCYNTDSNCISVSQTLSSDSVNPFQTLLNSTETAPPTPTASNLSGSDPETASKPTRNAVRCVTGRVSKRKSRPTKRAQTTFISLNPADFRQMVQQVTGFRFGNTQLPVVPVLKPELERPSNRLPTLDTSAFLLDHHQQQLVMSSSASGSGSGPGPVVGSGPVAFTLPAVADGGSRIDCDTYSSFPTLESWEEVM